MKIPVFVSSPTALNGVQQESYDLVIKHLIESGILFGLKLPLLIFREANITGGVFDEGVTELFVQKMPNSKQTKEDISGLNQVFLKWYARVSENYFRF